MSLRVRQPFAWGAVATAAGALVFQLTQSAIFTSITQDLGVQPALLPVLIGLVLVVVAAALAFAYGVHIDTRTRRYSRHRKRRKYNGQNRPAASRRIQPNSIRASLNSEHLSGV